MKQLLFAPTKLNLLSKKCTAHWLRTADLKPTVLFKGEKVFGILSREQKALRNKCSSFFVK